MKGVLLAIVALLFVPSRALSQTSNAHVTGVVEDANHAAIPMVPVTAKNLDTGVVTTAQTSDAGVYHIAGLRPGFYEILARAPRLQPRAYEYVFLVGSQETRLNFTLEVGPEEQTIEMFLPMNSLQPAASVGSVLMASSLDALPTGAGNALDLVMAAPGTIGSNFAGGRVNQVSTTRDGIRVNDGRYDNGVYSQTYVSADLIEEVQVVISPADAEFGRGAGQVRLTTRSGNNQFHGTMFWADRNSALDANSWFNNFTHANKNYLNRNQFGGRLSGPLIKNKTFFFALYEGMRTVQKESVFADVLTAEARKGNFRYFPGVLNANARAAVPTVDLLGNPIQPAQATGPLTSFNLFGRTVNGVFTAWDPNRAAPDPTGLMQAIYGSMPLPNEFIFHDGLNVAHYRWVRRRSGVDDVFGSGTDLNRDEINVRIDHHFNSRHRANFSVSREHTWADNNMSFLPGGFNGQVTRHPQVYTSALVSAFKGTLVNELRFGLRRGKTEDLQAYDVPGKTGEEARKYLGQSNGIPYLVSSAILVTNYQINDSGGSRANVVPLYTYGDTLGWSRGAHAFKGGVELRFGSNNAWNSDRIIPRVVIGAGVPVTGITATTIPGLVGTNQGGARNLLNDLAGSVLSIEEAFTLAPDPKNIAFQDYRQLSRKARDIHQNEWSAFFKDDWKVRPNLTVNLGLRYEFFGVPYESHGLTAAPVGGGSVITAGSLSIAPEFVGKNSPQPDKQLYKNDWNNLAPAVGLSWSIPYFGQDKTILRAGYGISYQGGGRGFILDTTIGAFPGVNQFVSQRPASYLDLSKLTLPAAGKAPDGKLPVVPLTARNDIIYTWDPNLVTPYVQSTRLEIQRSIVSDLTMSVRYVGSKGTKLFGFVEQNYQNVISNGLLDAMNITRAGGDAPLFDKMFKGLNFGTGVIDGVNLTGSAALRQNSDTTAPLANGNLANLAYYLNSTAVATGVPGGLLRNGGLPEDFIVRNPQFLDAYLQSNLGSSTYHSLQVAAAIRPTHGFSSETTYTWSRAIGEADDDLVKLYVDPMNRSRDKSLLSFHRTHDLRSNGMYELPLGRGQMFLSNASPLISRLVEHWQLGAIFSLSSGAPLSILAGTSPFSPPGSLFGAAGNFPDIVGNFPKDFGKVTMDPIAGPIYFADLKQVSDPARTNITPKDNLATAATLLAVTDAQGNMLLQNAKPGTIGNMGRQWLEGPGRIGLDVDLQKQVTLSENRTLELRVDALNVLNHPQFANPVTNLNGPNFGRINAATGNRTFTLSARVSF